MTGSDVHPDDMFDDPVMDAFARDVREAAAATPAPVPGAALATIFRDGLTPVAEPTSARGPRPTRRRRLALRGAVAGVVAGLGVGGLGVAGALPDPVQRQVVRAAKVIGVELPAPAAEPAEVEVESRIPDDIPATPPTTVADRDVGPPDSTPGVTAPGRVDKEDNEDDDDVEVEEIDEDDDAGRGRSLGSERRDDRADDAGSDAPTTSTTPAPRSSSATSTSVDRDRAEDRLDRGEPDDRDADEGDPDDGGLDDDRRGRDHGQGRSGAGTVDAEDLG